MKLPIAVFALLLVPLAALAASFKTAVLASDGTGLVLTSSDGARFDAPRLPDQVAFDQPNVSPDGHYVGWLASFPNCCTSYPVPLALVVIDASKHVHTFEGSQLAISSWCFLPSSTAVAYAQGVLHGSDARLFELRSIADGRLISRYEYPHDEAKNMRARSLAPSWVRCASP